MRRRARPQPSPRHDVGEWALSFGLVAAVCSFVPVIGDFVGIPAGLLAVVLGVVGIRRYERRLAAHVVSAVAGAAMGALAILAAVTVLMVAELSP
jgi:membrane protein YqaA with SNARE-associated domain